LSWSGVARGLADDARVRGRGGGKRKREAGGWRLLSRSGRRGGGEQAGAGRGSGERKGKADGWDPPVSCPGQMDRERSRCFAMMGWAGVAGPVRVREKEREKGEREEDELGRGCVGRWAGGPWGY
jgi:hypothetical protein